MFIKNIFKKPKKIHSEKMPFELWRLLTTSFLSASPLFISKIRIEMGEDFTHLELRGICLKNFDLTNANFEGTDLSDADLGGANLENAKLVSTKLNSADLSNTKLTGICIQNWQVTDSTKFEGVDCKYIYLTPENQKDDFRRELNPEELEDIDKFFKELLISSEAKKKIKELKELFDTIDLIGDKVIREYRLAQAVKSAKDSHWIEGDIFHQMFEDYRKQKLQAKRQSSWWQNFLWFKLEPSIERLNNLTKEMDIFPLLEQMGRLSILIAVIAYVNNALQPPKLNVEEQYRSWEILRSDNDKVKGIRRFALEQLRDKGTTLKKIQVPPSVDLSGINLSNTDLTGAILKNVNLQNANLSRAKLQEADLRGADLKEASLGYSSSSDQNNNQGFNKNILQNVLPLLPLPSVLNQGADLRGANLTEANLTEANLTGANLTTANLTTADPTIQNPTGANLTRANLTRANLTRANLTRANLTRANLTGANLTGANLTTADLTTADLTGANLKGANLTTADLTGANLTTANLTTADLTTADLRWANLKGANLTTADLRWANLTTANLTRANLKGAKNLKDVTSWQLTNLSQADFSSFDEKKLKGSKFEGAFYLNEQAPSLPGKLKPEELKIQPIEKIKDLQSVNLSGVDLSNANLSGADLRKTDLNGTNLSGADLRKTDLAGANLKGAEYSKATKFPKGFKPQAEGMVEIN